MSNSNNISNLHLRKLSISKAVAIGKKTVGSNILLDVSGNVNATTYYGDGSHLTGISNSNISFSSDISTNNNVRALAFYGDGSHLTGIVGGGGGGNVSADSWSCNTLNGIEMYAQDGWINIQNLGPAGSGINLINGCTAANILLESLLNGVKISGTLTMNGNLTFTGGSRTLTASATTATFKVLNYTTSLNNTSDERLKKNITDISENALQLIEQLRPVNYQWNDLYNQIFNTETDASGNNTINSDTDEYSGFIAQELENVLPLAVGSMEANNTTYKTIKPIILIPYLVKAIQELSSKNTKLTDFIKLKYPEFID